MERDGRFLLVEEQTATGLMLNQPAGHLEAGETLVEAVVREALEETAHGFVPEALVGIYKWHSAASEVTYLRFAFAGTMLKHDAARKLDEGIVRAVWMTADEIAASRARHRSPYVLTCVQDWLAGQRYPLALLHESVTHQV
jgi:8-oxo-dGTP pyrophosphatase MutT (NUDIX family)